MRRMGDPSLQPLLAGTCPAPCPSRMFFLEEVETDFKRSEVLK
jgi:hypothetical protein